MLVQLAPTRVHTDNFALQALHVDHGVVIRGGVGRGLLQHGGVN